MSYIFILSLEEIALVKVASTLWNQSDTRKSIRKCFYDKRGDWKSIEKEVIKKVEKLPQPDLLKEKITRYVRFTGFQILKWIEYHSNLFRILSEKRYIPPPYFSWTPYGTIDSKETARLLIQYQAVHPIARYQLAFIYCLEGDIRIIWDSIPKVFKGFRKVASPTFINEQNLADVWTSGNPDGCFWNFPEAETGSYETSFLNAVKLKNKVAVEYFFQKLTPGEREVCLEEAALASEEAEVLCFLLSQMDEEQQKFVLQKNGCSIMEDILKWPWSSFFVETANYYWDFTKEEHTLPLQILVNDVHCGNNDLLETGIYRELFKELWQCACNRFGADKCADSQLLSKLFQIKDKENIRMIFGDASLALKKDFIWSSTGLNISSELMWENNWDLLEFFIQQCLTSEHEMEQYRKKLCIRSNDH